MAVSIMNLPLNLVISKFTLSGKTYFSDFPFFLFLFLSLFSFFLPFLFFLFSFFFLFFVQPRTEL